MHVSFFDITCTRVVRFISSFISHYLTQIATKIGIITSSSSDDWWHTDNKRPRINVRLVLVGVNGIRLEPLRANTIPSDLFRGPFRARIFLPISSLPKTEPPVRGRLRSGRRRLRRAPSTRNSIFFFLRFF